MSDSATSAMVGASEMATPVSHAPDRFFKYWLVGPAILLLLLVGLFPLIYSLVVSFQNITMMEVDTSFAGFINYAQLFKDARLWQALLHTALITVIALPLELVFGLLMAQLFLERMPGRQIFVSLLVLPTVISPIVAGATWRLMFDNRYGPINQVIGWFAGEPTTLLWNVNPTLVYPAIFICEVWQWTPFMFLILLAALSNVDKSLTEAAEIDGAGYWRTFFKIVLPEAATGIAATAVFCFITAWNEYAFALMLTNRRAQAEPLMRFRLLRVRTVLGANVEDEISRH